MFSDTEIQIIELLGNRKVTITDLTLDHYKGRKKPINPNNVVAGTIGRINKKCKYHKLTWFINGTGLGRGGKTVWKDKKKGNA